MTILEAFGVLKIKNLNLIAIVGLTGSGKSEVTSILEKENYHKIRFGDITEELILQAGKEINETNERAAREGLRREHGMAAYAKLNLPKIEAARNEGKKVVIDGLYSWEEYKVLKQQFPELFILSIQTSPLTRYDRLSKREQRPLTGEESLSRDFSEIENINKAGPISMAEATILNESSKEDLRKEVHKLTREESNKRASWDEYFMGITREVASRATCDRGRSGSVIVKNKRLLSTGYVGSPVGAAHCDEVGHLMTEVYDKEGNKSQHCIRTTHAEQNAMVQAARFGIPLDGATIYCKMEPCHVCAKMIINAGIKRVVAEKMYHKAQITRDLFQEAEIDLVVLNKEVENYKGQ